MDITELKAKFVSLYGGDAADVRVFSAAGRVNLIGEHIDYNGGRVFPAGLSLRCLVLARKNGSDKVRLRATTIGDAVDLDVNDLGAYRGLKWGNYQAGTLYTLQKAGFDIAGCDLLYDADVPFGGGLSSSAAIEVATAAMAATFSNEKKGLKKPLNLVELAKLCQRAENEYAGVNCGIMDQFASAAAKKDYAILLDCNTLKYKYVPLKLGDYRLIIADTNKKRSLADSKYNERRAECDEALKILRTKIKADCLCAVTPKKFEKYKGLLSGKVRDRAEHAVYENERVSAAAAALKKGDLATFGKLLNASHKSLKELYEVTGAELDAIVEAAQNFNGCLGARMTGAGFGGCAVALVETDLADKFIAEVGKAYKDKIGYEASFYVCDTGDGAREIV